MKYQPHIINLFSRMEDHMDAITPMIKNAPFEDPEYYAMWISQFYHFVCHATRLLSASASRLEVDRDGLHMRFLDHSQEEKHHETFVVQDLQGLDRDIKSYPEHPLTAQLYQSQYYLIDYKDPVSLFGSILYLEGLSLHSALDLYYRVKALYGDKATYFLKTHTAEDVSHIEQAKNALSVLTEREAKFVEKSLDQSASIFENLNRDLLRLYNLSRHKKAA